MPVFDGNQCTFNLYSVRFVVMTKGGGEYTDNDINKITSLWNDNTQILKCIIGKMNDNDSLTFASGYNYGGANYSSVNVLRNNERMFRIRFDGQNYYLSYGQDETVVKGQENIENYIIQVMQADQENEIPGNDFILRGGKLILNRIKYGPPGTGKTHSLVDYVRKVLSFLGEVTNLNIHKISKATNQMAFVTFHQSFSYEEFVEGIRAEVNDNGQVHYIVRNGIFKRLCKRAYFYKVKALVVNNNEPVEIFSDEALACYENNSIKKFSGEYAELYKVLSDYQLTESPADVKVPKFVLCIDEINRANISKVLGELITLIEDSKRQGAKDAISLTLPYSGEDFFVPDNLYIVGTMNTSDHSLAKLDIALRRRFYFDAYYPDPELLKDWPVSQGVLKRLNEFLEKELDREHTIGHSYLMGLDDDLSKISIAFKMKIIPLLQEYFLHEPTKVQEALKAAVLPAAVITALAVADVENV